MKYAGMGEQLEEERSKIRASAKFQPCQIVRIKKAAELEDPGVSMPPENSMGKTGVVEMEGKAFISSSGNAGSLEQVYSVRIDGLGSILASENWLEDWEIPS